MVELYVTTMLWGTHTDNSSTVPTSKSPLLPTPSPSPLPSSHPASPVPHPSVLVSLSLYLKRTSLLYVPPRTNPDVTDFRPLSLPSTSLTDTF
jgi:hypothetical protein